jgi:ribosomal-protein-serine acetyltransferase
MATPLFVHDLGGSYRLALRDMSTVEAMHDLIVKNLDRLRRWEAWAQSDQHLDDLRAYTRAGLAEWADGRSLPCVILAGEAPVGAIGAAIDRYTQTAGLGYWIDEAHEGRGAVSRAASVLLAELFEGHGMHRVEIRTGSTNTRSRALAKRHGFTHEGTLRAAVRVGDSSQDIAVYGLLAGEWDAQRGDARARSQFSDR